jgi:hypothetical protein
VTVIDLRAVLSAYLLSSGTLGRREAELRKRFRHIAWEDVLMELQFLWEKEQVQRFTIDRKHIWRATDKLNV